MPARTGKLFAALASGRRAFGLGSQQQKKQQKLLLSRSYATVRPLSVGGLQTQLTSSPKGKLPNSELVFGRTFSDHMLSAEWTAAEGWANPKIDPIQNLSLHPSAMVFHYGMECFEGMKAYRDAQGKIRLFRPDLNMARLQRSCKRLALPGFDESALVQLIGELLKVEREWIPQEKGYSLYLRPTMIATQESLGVGSTDRAMLFVICSPVGPYYRTGFAPVKLLADPRYVRAWPGGTGDAKIGGNYAPTVLPQIGAGAEGCSQILWLYGENHQVTEVGTMNLFTLWKDAASGEEELVTAPLDGTILPGVTRNSILQLARDMGVRVSERTYTMPELVQASAEGRIVEMFGAGTACIVSPVEQIKYLGQELNIPLALGNAGKLTKALNERILAIQYGEEPSEWSVVVD